MNPFDANERHRYIIESGGNPVSSADGYRYSYISLYEMGIFTTVLFRTYAWMDIGTSMFMAR